MMLENLCNDDRDPEDNAWKKSNLYFTVVVCSSSLNNDLMMTILCSENTNVIVLHLRFKHLLRYFYDASQFYLPVCVSFTERSHNKQHVTLHLNINSVILISTGAGIQKDSYKIFRHLIKVYR